MEVTYVGVCKLPTFIFFPLGIPEACAYNIGLRLSWKINIIYSGHSTNLSVIKNGVNSLCWKKSVWYVYVYSMWTPNLIKVTARVSRHPCIVILFMKSGFIALLLVFYFQLYSSLAEDYGDNKRWIFFCEEETIINLFGLVQVLRKHDARKVAENNTWLLVYFSHLLHHLQQ